MGDPQYRPQYMIVPIRGALEGVPLILGHPHILLRYATYLQGHAGFQMCHLLIINLLTRSPDPPNGSCTASKTSIWGYTRPIWGYPDIERCYPGFSTRIVGRHVTNISVEKGHMGI